MLSKSATRSRAEADKCQMVVFPNAKINLGLNIIRRRPDGYHDLETGFYPIAWKDVLECSSLPASSVATEPELIVTGQSIQGLPQENICLRAWQVLHNAFPSLPLFICIYTNACRWEPAWAVALQTAPSHCACYVTNSFYRYRKSNWRTLPWSWAATALFLAQSALLCGR